MFTLNAFSLDVICFLCYSSFSMVQALRDSDEYFSKKFLCWPVCRLHNEYKLTKCEILLPTKLMRLWLSERSVRCPSVLRAELNLWLLITSLGLLTLGIYRTFFFSIWDEVSWKNGRRFFNYCQRALQEKSRRPKKSAFHSNRQRSHSLRLASANQSINQTILHHEGALSLPFTKKPNFPQKKAKISLFL